MASCDRLNGPNVVADLIQRGREDVGSRVDRERCPQFSCYRLSRAGRIGDCRRRNGNRRGAGNARLRGLSRDVEAIDRVGDVLVDSDQDIRGRDPLKSVVGCSESSDTPLIDGFVTPPIAVRLSSVGGCRYCREKAGRRNRDERFGQATQIDGDVRGELIDAPTSTEVPYAVAATVPLVTVVVDWVKAVHAPVGIAVSETAISTLLPACSTPAMMFVSRATATHRFVLGSIEDPRRKSAFPLGAHAGVGPECSRDSESKSWPDVL